MCEPLQILVFLRRPLLKMFTARHVHNKLQKPIKEKLAWEHSSERTARQGSSLVPLQSKCGRSISCFRFRRHIVNTKQMISLYCTKAKGTASNCFAM